MGTVNRPRKCGNSVATSSLKQVLQLHRRQLTNALIQLVHLAVVKAQTNQALVQGAEAIVKSTRMALVRDVGKSPRAPHHATCVGQLAWQMMAWAARLWNPCPRC